MDILMATFVRPTRKRVCNALTRADDLDAWLTTGTEIDARPGVGQGNC